MLVPFCLVLYVILKTHIPNIENPVIEDNDWPKIADEIRFFFDLPSDIPRRPKIWQVDIIDQSKIVDELVNGFAITNGESDKYFILAKNISHCITLTFYNKSSQTGGMAYMVWAPQFAQDAERLNISRIDDILAQFEQAGVNLASLDVQMFGGKILGEENADQIVFINKIYQALIERNIKVKFRDILGYDMRHIAIDTKTGEIYDLVI